MRMAFSRNLSNHGTEKQGGFGCCAALEILRGSGCWAESDIPPY